MKILAFDIETDGLLMDATKVHCLVSTDITTKETLRFRSHEMVAAYKHLLTADRLVAHNGMMFDIPTMERLVGFPNNLPQLPKCFDTLLTSRLLWPDKKGDHPAGGHALKQWGEFLSNAKGEQPTDWSTYTEEMLEYCVQDVAVTIDIYDYIIPRCAGLSEAIRLEHRVAEIITKQIQNGFPVDMQKVEALHRELTIRLAELQDNFSHIPPWVEKEELKTPAYWEDPITMKRYAAKKDVVGKGSGAVKARLKRGPNKIKRTEILFNPGAAAHKARLFVEKYNWKPKKLGDQKTKWFPGGVPCMDKAVMATLDFPEAKVFTEISKVSDLLNTYVSAWMRFERDGRIHGDVITTGCRTSRMAHMKPGFNIPKVDKPWGFECRDCFGAREGWLLVGGDASGLQERGLAHYMHRWDGGQYARSIEEGCKEDSTDSHSMWCKALGYDPTKTYKFGSVENNAREQAKTHKYATMFGGQPPRQASILGITVSEMKRKLDEMYARLPGLAQITKSVQQAAKSPSYHIAIDGRRVPILGKHTALVDLLQGFEQAVMKKALCLLYRKAEAAFGEHGVSWALCGNYHDEIQAEAAPVIAPLLGQLIVGSIREAGEYFELNIQLDGDWKVGRTWAETH